MMLMFCDCFCSIGEPHDPVVSQCRTINSEVPYQRARLLGAHRTMQSHAGKHQAQAGGRGRGEVRGESLLCGFIESNEQAG